MPAPPPSARSKSGGLRTLWRWLRSLVKTNFDRLLESIAARARYAESKMVAINTVAFLGFPLYYVVWTRWIPQPFESLSLRIAGSLITLPMLFAYYWPARLRRWLPLYWYASVTLAGPCFFTYMMLMNGMNTVWLSSHLAAMYLLLLLFDLSGFLATYLLGTALAVAAYVMTPHLPIPTERLIEAVPLWVFAIVSGIVFNISQSIEIQTRMNSLSAVTATIAHELRTPLSTIRLAAGAALKYLGLLTDTYKKAQEAGLKVPPLREAHFAALQDGAFIVEREVNHALVTIDMLLAAARPFSSQQWQSLQASVVVTEALNRYPFESAAEQARVSTAVGEDFNFLGSKPFVVHVLFNLMKNALYHTARAGYGNIQIHVIRAGNQGQIVVKDTGPGIEPDLLPRIFERFVSSAESSETGLGIGLNFCREAIESMNGTIRCRSALGAFTEFTLSFPLYSGAVSHVS